MAGDPTLYPGGAHARTPSATGTFDSIHPQAPLRWLVEAPQARPVPGPQTLSWRPSKHRRQRKPR